MIEMRRALLVGIDDYPASPLAGCVNDAKAMAMMLSRNDDDSPNFDCKPLLSTDETVTRALLLENISELLATKGDVALLYFAGHGLANNLDGFLVTTDAAKHEEGVAFAQVLTLANNSDPSMEVVILLDSCQSGAMGDIPAIGNVLANIREGVTILTASRSTENASERNGHGVFTSIVLGALGGGAADVLGKVTIPAVYSYADEALGPWEQRPLMKAHVSKLVPIRYASPAIDLGVLRKFPEWFPDEDSEFPLDPSFEPTEEPNHPENEAIFDQLQKCRATKLVEPVGEEHMYFAALKSKSCRLTPLGQKYWRQAKDNRI